MKHGLLPKLITAFLTAVFLLLGIVPQSRADKVTFYHNDHLGSPLAMTDMQGNVVWRRDYKPFGQEVDPGGATATNAHKYTGKEYDAETGLYYYGARYYDPTIGRFISVDPAGGKPEIPQTWNRYIYTLNNPYKYVDPDGEDTAVANRQLGGKEARSRLNPLTHTLTFTYAPETLTVKHTYSWGTEETRLKDWKRDYRPDKLAAQEALSKGKIIQWIGDSSLDPHMEETYREFKGQAEGKHEWLLDNSCKAEAFRLINRAEELREMAERGQELERQVPVRPSLRPRVLP